MVRDTRPVSWIKAARKDFEEFPRGAQDEVLRALTIVAEGGHPDMAKPLKGLDSGILELALRPLPAATVLGVCHFPTLRGAMDAVQHIVRLGPSAVELVDRTLLGLARENVAFRGAIALLATA